MQDITSQEKGGGAHFLVSLLPKSQQFTYGDSILISNPNHLRKYLYFLPQNLQSPYNQTYNQVMFSPSQHVNMEIKSQHMNTWGTMKTSKQQQMNKPAQSSSWQLADTTQEENKQVGWGTKNKNKKRSARNHNINQKNHSVWAGIEEIKLSLSLPFFPFHIR